MGNPIFTPHGPIDKLVKARLSSVYKITLKELQDAEARGVASIHDANLLAARITREIESNSETLTTISLT